MSHEVTHRWIVSWRGTAVQKLTPDLTYKGGSGLEVTWQLSLRPYDQANQRPIILNQLYQKPSILALKIKNCIFESFLLSFKLQVLQKVFGVHDRAVTVLTIESGLENIPSQTMFHYDPSLPPSSPHGNLYWIIFKSSLNPDLQTEIVFTIRKGTGIGRPFEMEAASDNRITDCEFHSKFWKMYEENRATDASIIVKTEEVEELFKVHWLVMEARSPVLAAMFKHECLEKEERIVVIVDFSVSVIENFIKFLYKDECDLQDKYDVMQLLACAEKYDVQNLKIKCQAVLAESLSAENAVDTLQMAHLHCADLLKDAALNFITNHYKEFVETPNWKSMTNELLNDVIKSFGQKFAE